MEKNLTCSSDMNVSSISITIPIHNEQDNIESLYSDIVSIMTLSEEPFEIIFVNDGSSDCSKEILNSIAEKDRRVKVIHFVRNFGQTYAMMAGFDHASGDVIIAMDGDNQNDPADIPKLLNKIKEGYDVVSGWRKNRQDAKLSRIIPSMTANWLISQISGVQLHDYGCSLKAYRKKVIKDIQLYGELHRFIPIFTSWRGAKLAEIEVNHRPRSQGSSHYGLSRIIRVILDLTLIRFLDKHIQHPIHLFGGFGLLNFVFASLTFLLMIYYKFWGNKSFIETPLPILVVLFLLIGIVALLLGILAEMLMRTYFESQRKKPYLIDEIVNDDV